MKYTNWYPINNNNEFSKEDFDKRFEIDRTYYFNGFLYKYHIRFVRYPNNKRINVFTTSIFKLPKFVHKYIEKTFHFAKQFNILCSLRSKKEYLSRCQIKEKYNYTF